MSEKHAPVVYLFHGDDEFAVSQAVGQLIDKMGDRAMVEMNTTRLDGGTASLEQIVSAAAAVPFLAARRLVIVTNPAARYKDKTAHARFTDMLLRLPHSTALVLVSYAPLTSDRDRRSNKLHWLERWALEHAFDAKDEKGLDQGKIALLREFTLPRGAALAKRLQEMTRERGGVMTPDAADLLGALVDGDVRLAANEIDKLLAYVNYARPVQPDDVQALTTDVGEGDIFAMVDALSSRDSRKALDLLERLLEYQEYYGIFGMIVRQFRLLLLARDALDRGASGPELIKIVGGSSYVAGKMSEQARSFRLPDLERAYRRLLELDQAVKTSQVSDRIALETFVAGFTARV
ncbi:MAG: DNA polymerase III subunit delta [Chloroflexota bacterium]